MEEKTLIDYSNVEDCPVRQVLNRFGDKWSTLVILVLAEKGVLRFNELSKTIEDVSQKMLTTTLRTLEADGLVHRKVYPEVPPRVEYKLTPLAETLVPHIQRLTDWANENFDEIKHARKAYAK
ncbi:MAG: transcriptional regulator [Balneola sp.]|jgi:DNA-binding HxlR family transcriptional regulator|nr:transcriptional regulator [Balneola sp.]MBE78977.1 transcriptional regulator [Balneola sp.]HBX65256.1 transcriptional regulator [Balneolaceae bacterium]|tara:strand:- start:66 stop:434 length:369 start_codon:yes stop_codon:yes gene_type:complete